MKEMDQSQTYEKATKINLTSSPAKPENDLPQYYDSWPSSQPPNYDSTSTTKVQANLQHGIESLAKPYQYGEPAATIAAVCAPITNEDNYKKKKGIRNYWNDLKVKRAAKKFEEDEMRNKESQRSANMGQVRWRSRETGVRSSWHWRSSGPWGTGAGS